MMVSRRRDRDCFKAYMKSGEHHERIYPGLEPAIKLEGFEHMYTYEIVAG